MLHVKLEKSQYQGHLKWCIEAMLSPGVCHHLKGENGAGKTTFIEELKIQWSTLAPDLLLGFTDQALLQPFQDLTVEALIDVMWDVTQGRHEADDWRELSWWQELQVQKWMKRKVSELSGGENQWIKILMMRSLKCDAWILDEPFQSLDSGRQTELWKILEAWIQAGKYLILTHHGEVLLKTKKTWTLNCSTNGLSLEGVA